MSEHIQTIIVGGGQAGLSASYCLSQRGCENLVLEKADQPASAWHSERWDSFTLVTPNWTMRLPGGEYRGSQPDGFMSREELVAYFADYAERNRLPVAYGVQVESVELDYGGYRVKAGSRDYWADNVIIATGMFQKSKVPAFAVGLPADVAQIPSGKYRNPQALPPGVVLVVGSGQSGCQIADELYRAGRKVYLCVGSTGRVPRRYRGRDIVEWLMKIGFFDRTADKLPSPQARFASSPHVTGKDGGRSLNLHQYYRDGVVLLGRLRSFQDGRFQIAADLMEKLANEDQIEANIIKSIDSYVASNGLDAPEESLPTLRDAYSSPQLSELDLKSAGVTSVIWAMGHSFDFSLVKLPVFDAAGMPVTQRCAAHPGLYFVGLPWLTAFKSGFLVGLAEDADLIARQIAGD